ncbi:TetR/AcrR family transcriptional regulator [Pseudohaliea rubra]|uniref:Transcriptional regulator, TetR family n=1 Tax=Pseudohaliea rubra DSM 19751 TaxID=1265313 RepID=A0A095XXD4_9GAMM|nr:TetR/AcrR family transcriptional regulator [Pseudohaliea rubra]KGE04381.1 Transcriptional regulator, TetR family [Pseudohaliea rubra DSM 19751]
MAKEKPVAKSKSRRGGSPTFTEQARRTQIVTAAAALFMEQGFANTSMDQIASRVGVSRGVLFYYFDGKAEIGEHTLRLAVRAYSDYVRDRVERRRTARGKLREFSDACLDYQAEHPDLYIAFVELIGCLGENEEKFRLTQSLNQRTRSQLVAIIQGGINSGELANVDASALADILQGFVDGMMEMIAMEPGAVSLPTTKRLWHRMLDSVL